MRATLDRLISWTGLLLAVVLLVAGGLLTWANSFIGDQVHQQLSEQHITMPTADAVSGSDFTQADKDALKPFYGKQMLTGPAAKAYADHYIWVHMKAAAEGTYSSLNMQSPGDAYADVPDRATCSSDPTGDACAALTSLKGTLFQGNALRGLLLNAYAFGTIGTVSGYAAIGAYIAGLLMLILAGLGFVHARRVAEAA